jgi:hypothetical protein
MVTGSEFKTQRRCEGQTLLEFGCAIPEAFLYSEMNVNSSWSCGRYIYYFNEEWEVERRPRPEKVKQSQIIHTEVVALYGERI